MVDVKKYADEILDDIKARVDRGESHGHLVVITIGDDPASASYVRGKKKDCKRVGFGYTQIKFPEDCKTSEIVRTINQLRSGDLMIYDDTTCNRVPSSNITGLIVQLPVPENIDMNNIMAVIPRRWDVDGFLPKSPFKPCTPEGVMHIVKREFGDKLDGMVMTIVGRGKLVGAPLRDMALAENMTVVQCHSYTSYCDLIFATQFAHVAVFATGKPGVIRTKPLGYACPLIIDCGINVNIDGKLCGDVVVDSNYEHITPVPGGVGLMTRAMLIKHCEVSKCQKEV